MNLIYRSDIINIEKKSWKMFKQCRMLTLIYNSFKDDDLFYSLHSVKINLDGYKKDNKWYLNIELTDTYDFTEILSNDKYKDNKKKYLTKGNILNDFAAISSQYGVIKPYKITISFKWSDF